MLIDEYKTRVVLHFREGEPTENEWTLLGEVMLCASEGTQFYDAGKVKDLDRRILNAEEFAKQYTNEGEADGND